MHDNVLYIDICCQEIFGRWPSIPAGRGWWPIGARRFVRWALDGISLSRSAEDLVCSSLRPLLPAGGQRDKALRGLPRRFHQSLDVLAGRFHLGQEGRQQRMGALNIAVFDVGTDFG